MTFSGQQYVCSAGDTFDFIALMVYGDEKYAAELMTANPDLVGQCVFKDGEYVDLPVLEIGEEEEDEDDETEMPDTAPWKE